MRVNSGSGAIMYSTFFVLNRMKAKLDSGSRSLTPLLESSDSSLRSCETLVACWLSMSVRRIVPSELTMTYPFKVALLPIRFKISSLVP